MSNKAPTVHEVFFPSERSPTEQHALERRFFDRVALTNGTYKTTYPNRLDNVNEAFLPHIVKLAKRPIRIMDVGASSGISTSEWYSYLSRSGVDCDITGTDLTIYVSLVTFRFTSKVAALVDRDGNIVHFDLFGMGWPRQPSSKFFRPNTLRTIVARALFWGATMLDGKRLPAKAESIPSRCGRMLKYQPVALPSRSFAQNHRVRMIEDDLLAENNLEMCRAFDVIRAANVLQSVYFPVDLIERMLATLKQRLTEGGLLIIVKTEPSGNNNASTFRLLGNQFSVVDRFGNGSEIEHIISGH
jgi:hypothetical protein